MRCAEHGSDDGEEAARERAEALATLRELRRPLPPGFHFDREEANERKPE
jgi:hypothetical protein